MQAAFFVNGSVPCRIILYDNDPRGGNIIKE